MCNFGLKKASFYSIKNFNDLSMDPCVTGHNKGGQIKYPTMHHFQLYYQRADAKITSFLYGCARVSSSPSAGVSKIKIVLSISSIRSVSELTGSRLPFLKSKCYACELSTFSFEAEIAIE